MSYLENYLVTTHNIYIYKIIDLYGKICTHVTCILNSYFMRRLLSDAIMLSSSFSLSELFTQLFILFINISFPLVYLW